MKQTAVEWLKTILEGQKDKPFDFDEWSIAFEHAKTMEKDQIIESVENTIKSIELTKDKTGFFAMGGEGYYNETFKPE